MFLDVGLAKQYGTSRVEPDAQPIHDHLQSALLDSLWRCIVCCQRMPVRHEKVTAKLLLKSQPIFQRPMEVARWSRPVGLMPLTIVSMGFQSVIRVRNTG